MTPVGNSPRAKKVKLSIENWRREYNTVCPHSSLGYWTPAPELPVGVARGRAD
jgi:transposase InsO family protein